MDQPAVRTIGLTNGQVSRYDRAVGWIDVLPDFDGTEECVSCGCFLVRGFAGWEFPSFPVRRI